MEYHDIVILGSGPTGLGAATRLKQLGKEDWLMCDAFQEAGGLACTDITPEGFLFDMGGHVIFSHYDYFDQLIDAAVGTGDEHWAVHERVSYVRYIVSPFHTTVIDKIFTIHDLDQSINELYFLWYFITVTYSI
jgi:phytoene dehydrogenase-like protein